MGILGSAFGRALAGSGAAAAGIANKYIDEELATQRAQAFAAIARQGRNDERTDADAFNNDPARLERNRQIKRDDALSAGKTAEDVALSANTNQPLIQSAREKAIGDADAATTAKIDAAYRVATDPKSTEAQKAEAALKLEALQGEIKARTAGAIEVVNATEEARQRAGAYDRRMGADGSLKLPPGIKAELDALDERDKQINGAMVRAQADGMWDPEKNPSQKALQTQLAATRMRRSQIIAPYLETSGGGAPDPLGLRGGSKPGAAPAGGGQQPSTGDQGARDVEAGKLMIRSEYGGDIDKARAALAQIEAEAAKTQGEGRTIMLSEANRLRMGIEAYGKSGSAKPPAKPGASATDEGPGLMDRAAGFASKAGGAVSDFFTGMRSEGAAVQAIQARVREAASGGAPLTPQERQEARRFGIALPA